jgi:hypothetical protein
VALVAAAQLLSGGGSPIAFGQGATTTTTVVSTTTSTTIAPGAGPVYRPAVYRTNPHFFLRNTFSTGVADAGSFQFGDLGDAPLMCDWDGNGSRTPGVRRGITFFMRNSNTPGNADQAINFGNPSDTPLCGDWDGNGTETIGVWRAGEWFLFNRTDPGTDTNGQHFFFGNNTDVPLVGDWNGDNRTTSGVKRGFQYFIQNEHATGNASASFFYGNSDDVAVVGDFDHSSSGANHETIGVLRPSTGIWYLKNTLATGNADTSFGYGNGNDKPLTWFTAT